MKNQIKRWLHFCIMGIALATLIIAGTTYAETSAGKVLYVNKGNACPGKGTSASPYCKIQSAADAANPGDTVLVHGGSYTERIDIKRSGTRGKMIAFKPEPGTGKVFLRHPTRAATEGVVNLIDAGSYVRIEGFHFKDSPANSAIMIKDRNSKVDFRIVHTRVRNVEVVGNTFENVGHGNQAFMKVVLVFAAQDILVENNTFINSYGAMVSIHSGYRATVRNNQMRGIRGTPQPWNPKVKLASGVVFTKGANAPTFTLGSGQLVNGYHVIENNDIRDTDSSGSGSQGIWCDSGGHSSLVIRNRVINVGYKGIFIESRCHANTIQENISSNNDYGFVTPSSFVKPLKYGKFINNIAYKNKIYGFVLNQVEQTKFINNIGFNNGVSEIMVTGNSLGKGNTFKNNLWFNSSRPNVGIWNCRLNEWPKGSGKLDDGFCNRMTDYAKQYQVTFAQWVKASGEESALSVNPRFVDAKNGNFRLNTESAAKRAGENGVDIGAFPSDSQTPEPVPMTPFPPQNLKVKK